MKIVSILLLVLAVFLYWVDVATQLEFMSEKNSNLAFYSLMVACICYGLLLMLPFVPALEVGVLIMVVYGASGVIGAYIATVISLLLSYLLGCFLIKKNHVLWFKNKTLMNVKSTPHGLLNNIVCKVLNTLNTRPYLSVALLLNMPGNAILGGGGGIALMAGASGKVRFHKYFLTVLVATSIIPILLLLGMLPWG